jgi:hypothetical protein
MAEWAGLSRGYEPRLFCASQSEAGVMEDLDDCYLELQEAVDEQLGPAFLEARDAGDAAGVEGVQAELQARLRKLYGLFRKALIPPFARHYVLARCACGAAARGHARSGGSRCVRWCAGASSCPAASHRSLYDAYELEFECAAALRQGEDSSALSNALQVRRAVAGLLHPDPTPLRAGTQACATEGASAPAPPARAASQAVAQVSGGSDLHVLLAVRNYDAVLKQHGPDSALVDLARKALRRAHTARYGAVSDALFARLVEENRKAHCS